jgi:glycosyltransferase involved in cell wall biosynthesis
VPRVVYDSQVFAEQQHGGVTRYFLSLADSLGTATSWTPLLALGLHVSDSPIPNGVLLFGPRMRMPALAHSFRARRAVNTLMMGIHRPANDGHTVFHPTWYHQPMIARWGHLPMVVTIHDLIPEAWPAVTTKSQLAYRKQALTLARAVLCVSRATRDKLAEHYPWAVEKAIVAQPGLSPLPAAQDVEVSHGSYLLHIGKRGAYKDFATVIRSLSHANPELKVVAAGGGPLRAWEQQLLEHLGVSSRLIVEPNVSDQRLADLLAGSLGLVSASREEGFGLPALEALAAGKPVILSDIPVYRELYSRWATFFPPGNAEALGVAITSVFSNEQVTPPDRGELKASFSWEATARATASAYDKAVS